jgi:hypothetical protein
VECGEVRGRGYGRKKSRKKRVRGKRRGNMQRSKLENKQGNMVVRSEFI